MLALVATGELTFSSPSGAPRRQGWASAAAAVARRAGSACSMERRRSMAAGSMLLQASPAREKFISLFLRQTSSYLLPSNSGRRVSRMWKITPAEKMSHCGSMRLLSVSSMISGATYPGVPQRKKRYLSISAKVARPQSTMMAAIDPVVRIMMFSGLRSRCMILSSCILLSPLSSPTMNSLTSSSEKQPFRSWMRWKSCPPVISSSTTQIEFSDSKTHSSLRRLLCDSLLRARMMFSSFMRLYFPFLAEKQACFEKAFTAKRRPSVSRSTSQTEAKLPLPSLRRGLNMSWKPSWLRCCARQMFQASMAAGEAKRVRVRVASKKSRMARLGDRMLFYWCSTQNLRSKVSGKAPVGSRREEERGESSRVLSVRVSRQWGGELGASAKEFSSWMGCWQSELGEKRWMGWKMAGSDSLWRGSSKSINRNIAIDLYIKHTFQGIPTPTHHLPAPTTTPTPPPHPHRPPTPLPSGPLPPRPNPGRLLAIISNIIQWCSDSRQESILDQICLEEHLVVEDPDHAEAHQLGQHAVRDLSLLPPLLPEKYPLPMHSRRPLQAYSVFKMNDYGNSTSRSRPVLKSPNPHAPEDPKTLKRKLEQMKEALRAQKKNGEALEGTVRGLREANLKQEKELMKKDEQIDILLDQIKYLKGVIADSSKKSSKEISYEEQPTIKSTRSDEGAKPPVVGGYFGSIFS